MEEHKEKTMDQRRAEDSMKKVEQIQQKLEEKDQDRYADYVERLPAAILANGLGQAAAQLLAAAKREKSDGTKPEASENEKDHKEKDSKKPDPKKQSPHYLLYHDLSSWLCRDAKEAPYPKCQDLLEGIRACERDQYMLAQAEALAWLEWHKKLAVAYLKRPEGRG